MRTFLGIARSLWIYRARRSHGRALVTLYRDFVPEGGLVFDIGAHVGDRVKAFRTLGARVVALEPQRSAYRVLRLLHGRDRGVVLVPAAAGAEAGTAALLVNRANPTVSTLSQRFVAAARGARGWHGQAWDRTETVAVTTLGELIERHGTPDFIKIDVEGAEAEVLAGLDRPVAALSFEIVTMARKAALEALEVAVALGFDRFRLSLGESHAWAGPWLNPADMRRLIADLPESANSGDVYARHPTAGA